MKRCVKMDDAFICDGIRTPIGRYGGALAHVRSDDLAAHVIATLCERHSSLDCARIDDVILGCANQAGEDNRNVARMAGLLADLPVDVPGVTVNRLCGSGMNAVMMAAQAIRSGEAGLILAGGVESMSRAPFVIGKAETAFSRGPFALTDTTIGWRFVNDKMKKAYGVDAMPATAENVAREFGVSRKDQDLFALRSQHRYGQAKAQGYFDEEIAPVFIPQHKDEPCKIHEDEHPRADASLESLARLAPITDTDGTITAGNASGVNDGAAALLIASKEVAQQQSLQPIARILGGAVSGVEPRIMGVGPAYSTQKLLGRLGLSLEDVDVFEINEAFAAQALATMRLLGLRDDASHVNPNGGAIALGHPLGMSGARIVFTAARELRRRNGRIAIATMCIGVGQGISLAMERV